MRSVIGIIQIVGGSLGVLLLLVFGLLSGSFATLIGLPFFLLGIFAGYSYLKNKKIGKGLTLLNQGLQIVSFHISDVLYTYYSAISINLNISEGSLGFNFNYGSAFFVGMNNITPSFVSINLVAIAIVVMVVLNKEKRAI